MLSSREILHIIVYVNGAPWGFGVHTCVSISRWPCQLDTSWTMGLVLAWLFPEADFEIRIWAQAFIGGDARRKSRE